MIKSILRLPKMLSVVDATALITVKEFHMNSQYFKEIRDRVHKVKVGNNKYEEMQEGEASMGIISDQQDLFPNEHTADRLFDNIPYKELPIINIKATPNNTIMSLTDYKGLVQKIHSAGIEGYKNAKKGTNVAAQQAAISFSEKCLEKGARTVRVRVQGIGAGRTAAIKGLQIGGLQIVSITDDTRVWWVLRQRPRKQRRV